MGSHRLSRLIAACAAVGVFALAGPAWAEMTININPGNLTGKPASEWGDQECSSQLGNGPLPGKDIWVFNLSGNLQKTGVFTSLKVTFSTPSGDVVKTIPGADSGIVVQGHSKAWIAVPTGWILKAASAVITGEADQFVLTHTCPASGTGPQPSGSNGGGGGGGGGDNPPGTPLPKTGAAVTVMLGAGLLLTASGAGLVYLQRRRRSHLDDLP